MRIFLDGLKLRNYRGIGPDWQTCPQFAEMNFFVGPNNVGKSGILHFISKYLGRFQQDGWNNVAIDDQYNRGTSGATEIMIPEPIHKILDSIPLVNNSNFGHGKELLDRNKATLGRLLSSVYGADTHQLWHHYSNGSRIPELFPPFSLNGNILPQEFQNNLQALWATLSQLGGGAEIQTWINKILEHVRSGQRLSLPRCELVPALRQIGVSGQPLRDYSGTGLIDRLAEVEDPDYDAQSDRMIFDKINDFLETVTGEPGARINIPHHRRHVMVHTRDRVLPLSYLGTGIHEVIMIAAFCTLSDNCVICLEEPEIHLHPILQRKLINYLSSKTQNQYFIATHSHCFIDTQGAMLFEVSYSDKQTKVKCAKVKSDRHSICSTLGYLASDLVQSNAIIWVEGPTDRIYLNHWIQHVDPGLSEGIHYSIMFYGGRLLNHLTAADDEVSDFIELQNLNRNLAIVIDSDKSDEQMAINSTKSRIVEEFRASGAVAWVTKGREIENYLSPAQVQSALANVYQNFRNQISDSSFEHALAYINNDNEVKQADKIKISRAVTRELSPDLTRLDLAERVAELVAFVHDCNRK